MIQIFVWIVICCHLAICINNSNSNPLQTLKRKRTHAHSWMQYSTVYVCSRDKVSTLLCTVSVKLCLICYYTLLPPSLPFLKVVMQVFTCCTVFNLLFLQNCLHPWERKYQNYTAYMFLNFVTCIWNTISNKWYESDMSCACTC